MNYRNTSKILFLTLVVSASGGLTANERPSTLHFERVADFLEIHDPKIIKLKLETGETIETSYEGVEYDILYKWETEDESRDQKRKLLMTYNPDNGVEVSDPKSNITFTLPYLIKNHPIDLAEEECSSSGVMSYMATCKDLQLKAWDAELNRAYLALGGKNNPELRAAQRAWLAFRDAQIKYMKSHFNPSGTIWVVNYMSLIVDLTRTQANRLKSLRMYTLPY